MYTMGVAIVSHTILRTLLQSNKLINWSIIYAVHYLNFVAKETVIRAQFYPTSKPKNRSTKTKKFK